MIAPLLQSSLSAATSKRFGAVPFRNGHPTATELVAYSNRAARFTSLLRHSMGCGASSELQLQPKSACAATPPQGAGSLTSSVCTQPPQPHSQLTPPSPERAGTRTPPSGYSGAADGQTPGIRHPPGEEEIIRWHAPGEASLPRLQEHNRPSKAGGAGPPTTSAILCPNPRPAVDVTLRGVTLSFLQLLVSSGAIDPSWTIQEVMEGYVRPSTAATQCCLFDMVPASATGKPRYFVSHTWSRRLQDLLGLLHKHFAGDPGADAEGEEEEQVFLWIDIFAINQHGYEDKGCLHNDDVENLAKVVAATERTLFCLDDQCASLTRIWCLYEVWQTFLARGMQGLLVLTSAVGSVELRRVFNTFDVLKAQATQPQDRDRILRQIQLSIGSTDLNLQLKAVIVDSAVYEAQHSQLEGAELARIQEKAGNLLLANGRYDEAEAPWRAALEARTRLLGMHHPDTIRSLRFLASCRYAQGLCDPDRPHAASDAPSRAAEAEAMFRRALATSSRVLGPDHLDTIAALDGLASCLNAVRDFAEAERMFRQALEANTRLLGPDDPDTIRSLSNLATCVYAQGRLGEAERMYRQAVERNTLNTQALGPAHPDTLTAISNLAKCLHAQGRDDEAELLFRQALEARTRVLGPHHPDTKQSARDLQMKPVRVASQESEEGTCVEVLFGVQEEEEEGPTAAAEGRRPRKFHRPLQSPPEYQDDPFCRPNLGYRAAGIADPSPVKKEAIKFQRPKHPST